MKKEIAAMAGVSRPAVNLWLARYADEGIVGLLERKRGAGREQVPGLIRARIWQLPKAHRRMGCRTGRLGRW